MQMAIGSGFGAGGGIAGSLPSTETMLSLINYTASCWRSYKVAGAAESSPVSVGAQSAVAQA